MAIAYVNSVSATGSSSTATVNVASSTNGHVQIIAISVFGTPTISTPSGLTLIRSDLGASSRTNLFSRVNASEPASYSSTLGASTTWVAFSIAWSGVDNTTPIGANDGANDTSGTSVVAPSITTTTANAYLFCLFGVLAAATFTPPGSMTERIDANSVELCDELIAAAGATGTRTSTASSAGLRVGQSVEIIAATAASGLPFFMQSDLMAGYIQTLKGGFQ